VRWITSINVWPGGASISRRWAGKYDGLPLSVWNGSRLEFDLPVGIRRDWLIEAISEGGVINVLVERIVAGYTVDYEPRQWGEFTVDADAASGELDRLIDAQSNNLEEVYNLDWAMGYARLSYPSILQAFGLTTASSDAEIHEAVDMHYGNIEMQVSDDAVFLFDEGDIAEALFDIIRVVKEDGNE